MLLRLKTCMAGPGGCFLPGDLVDAEEPLAGQLLDGGYAEPAQPATPAAPATTPVPTTTPVLAQSAAPGRRGRVRRAAEAAPPTGPEAAPEGVTDGG